MIALYLSIFNIMLKILIDTITVVLIVRYEILYNL